MTVVRTRFAPSPTGYLHIGGARVALYCWLYAKKMQGKFILRIEDTDIERSTPESVQAILEGMAWLNLDYDEGPVYQTKRFARYREVIEKLLAEGKAYRCYCSKERLEQLRETQMANKEKPRYDGKCRHLATVQDEAYVIRFKNPQEGDVVFEDLIRGQVVVANQELDDLILSRSDGTPTYNFTVVVDDWDMQVTHVLRGDDHINNTPRQINILRALGAMPPIYAHLPMILGSDGKRLSKRHGAVNVMQYREDGFLPQALLNYLVRLGWSYGNQEIFTIEELIEYFDFKGMSRSSAAINQEKLLWLNQHYMKQMDPALLVDEVTWHLERQGLRVQDGPALPALIQVQVARVKTLKELVEQSRYFYEDIEVSASTQAGVDQELIPAIRSLLAGLQLLSDFTKESIHQLLSSIVAEYGLKFGKLAQPMRVILTGGSVSPALDSTILLLGRDKTVNRMTKFLNSL